MSQRLEEREALFTTPLDAKEEKSESTRSKTSLIGGHMYFNAEDRKRILKKMSDENVTARSVKKMFRELKGMRVFGSKRNSVAEKSAEMRCIEVVAFIQNLRSASKNSA